VLASRRCSLGSTDLTAQFNEALTYECCVKGSEAGLGGIPCEIGGP
jgi:hypothetical protein